MEKPDRVWAEIDLDCIAHNISQIRKKTYDTKIAAVIKADGYGHGAVEIAQTLCENGVYMLVVATMDEGISLRRNGITAPILVLGYICSEKLEKAIDNNLAATITNLDMAKSFSKTAKKLEKILYAHIKIDTGMNRVGFAYDDKESVLSALALSNIHYSGIFSHFSTADEEDTSYTDLQYARFLNVLNEIKAKGYDIALKHICNSGGVILHQDKYLDMVRPGIIIYGLYPSEFCKKHKGLELKCAMSFKSRIIQIKQVKKGQPISYGNRYVTEKDSIIATIACGYADGYSRVLSQKSEVYINGQRAHIIGSICMDMCMADITGLIGISDKDEVELFGPNIPVENLASICSTINYEYICKIGARVPRVYIKEGKMVKINNLLT
ncbi:MAG TPA: alanine racemase [Clostridia bacterium]|nr:MAG: Alanine racemase [Firmicutes bacterium ADurb.Bin146]HOD93132.1 alanine racemase [Clostridia bacterium]HQM39071.1 alanine racemase [Clostridia bacterium]